MTIRQAHRAEAEAILRSLLKTSVIWTAGLLTVALSLNRIQAYRRSGSFLTTYPDGILDVVFPAWGLATLGLVSGCVVGAVLLCARPRPDDPSPAATFRTRRMLLMAIPLLLCWTAVVVSYDPNAVKPLDQVMLVLTVSGALLITPLFLVEESLRWGEEAQSRIVAPLLALVGGSLLGAAVTMGATALNPLAHKRLALPFLWSASPSGPDLWSSAIVMGAALATAVCIWDTAARQWALDFTGRRRAASARSVLPLTVAALGLLVVGPRVISVLG